MLFFQSFYLFFSTFFENWDYFSILDLGEFVRNEFSQCPLCVLMWPLYQNTVTYCMEQNQWMTQTTLAACEIILPVYANNGFMTRLNEGNGLVYTVKAGEIIGRKKFKLALRSPRRKLPQLSWWWIITEIFCRYWWRESGFWNLHSFSPNHSIQLKGNISLRQTKV